VELEIELQFLLFSNVAGFRTLMNFYQVLKLYILDFMFSARVQWIVVISMYKPCSVLLDHVMVSLGNASLAPRPLG